MYYYLMHIVAAGNKGFEDWTQILVFVAMIVVYSLSGILKAKMKKKEPVTGEQKPHLPRPAGHAPRSQYQQGAQSLRIKIFRPQSSVQKAAVKAEKFGHISTTKLYTEPNVSVPVSQADQEILESPKYDSVLTNLPEFKHVSPVAPSETAQTITYFAEDFLDLKDSEALRRAILHYEILGKPMSLRGPGEQIIGL
jgi:hypothetical protein